MWIVEIFSLQMMQCRNAYSAYGLYNFNCKHICSCIGIITTYMVIMIQVTDSIKKDDKSLQYIKIKFAQLNAILQSMLTTTIDSPQHKRVLRMKDNWENDSSLSTIYRMYKANENLVKLKRIKQIHLELMKCARIIMEAYGIPIIMSMTISIIFTIMLLYYILYELYEPSTSKEFRDEIRNFIFQLTQNRLTFTACGFYDLNHTFIYSAIGWITTYLVILIQVGDKPKLFKNVNNNSTL
uniref:uncharacterized protein LOC127061972 n=1 Tax=Vespula vulgaris TaxID=7454 RepID=UPI00223B91CA|nr:uncharacterized protein LOC127061972 [Vespula vulgaris]